MPTKRTRTTRGRTVLSLESFTIGEQFDFAVGWLPGRGRWNNWQEYAADYAEVRDQFLASEWMDGKSEPPFAELVFQRWGASGPLPGTDVRLVLEGIRR